MVAVNLVPIPWSPPPLYTWRCATGAHQPSIGLGVPDQNASQGLSWLLGQLVEINTNTNPLTYECYNNDISIKIITSCLQTRKSMTGVDTLAASRRGQR